MALFSRRKKSADDAVPVAEPTTLDAAEADQSAAQGENDVAEPTAVEPEAAAPTVGISVQAFRGVGAEAGPEVALPGDEPAPTRSSVQATQSSPASAPAAPATPVKRALPLAAAVPPEQTETVPGMKDNVLLREALAEIEAGATNEQLLGVLRQSLQGHLYLRVNGDASTQIAEGKQLSIAVVRDEDRSFMLAFSNAASVRDSVQRETDPTATSAVAQPVTSVIEQVISGGFTGLILDNASGVHRAVFPTEVLQKALDQADPGLTIKTLLAASRQADTAAKVGEALAKIKVWVAVNDGTSSGQVGIAEAQTPDGKRFLQVFSHPLEVVALGRGDRPMPFTPEQLAKVLSTHPEMAGVLVDPAGPSIIVERDALAPVLVLAVDLGD
ncbi:SseB family protein [Microbacterium sp. M28]|uniref:SseB family protein n=1 Tax=Microbacterium sp. M28 TaxID=2962064 RepID=UPI0021F44D94|nr:SseB family protein [Microbacterium sp. M28]UYO96298.1 SseB family protein [Microbacterium sp. M28]